MKTVIFVITMLLSISITFATTGVDVSDPVSQSDWSCLMSPGGQGAVEFAIVRVYQSSGNVDPNGASSVQNAASAGISTVDGYIFPCVSCGDGGSQVSAVISSMQSNGATIGTLWLDIEVYNWSDQTTNQNFITSMIQAGQNAGMSLGIYSSYYNWQSIVGLDWSYPSSQGLPLWYAHYDNNPSFSDFTSFGGWTSPTYKQYIGNANSCGVGVDYNYGN